MDEKRKEYRYKYESEKLKRIPLDVQKTYYETRLKPAADRAGEPVNTYIKTAIENRIRSEENNIPPIDMDNMPE